MAGLPDINGYSLSELEVLQLGIAARIQELRSVWAYEEPPPPVSAAELRWWGACEAQGLLAVVYDAFDSALVAVRLARACDELATSLGRARDELGTARLCGACEAQGLEAAWTGSVARAHGMVEKVASSVSTNEDKAQKAVQQICRDLRNLLAARIVAVMEDPRSKLEFQTKVDDAFGYQMQTHESVTMRSLVQLAYQKTFREKDPDGTMSFESRCSHENASRNHPRPRRERPPREQDDGVDDTVGSKPREFYTV